MCKKLKSDDSGLCIYYGWYMHKPESVPKNETRKILCEFEIKIDHLIPVGRQDIGIVYNKKKKKIESVK